jgi:hypothetical protein
MPEQKKKESRTKALPSDLPMPRYEYQKAATGTFTIRYDENSDRHRPAERKLVASLQHLKFAM